jgi:hypothetical protein
MKRTVLAIASILAMSIPSAYAMEHDHSTHNGHEAGMTQSGNIAHEEVVDGVKVTFKVQTMADAMKTMGMDMPAGVKETHHIHVEFTDVKTGKALTEGEVKVKVQGPDKVEQTKDLMGMQGHFGSDFDLSKKGKYGVMARFKLKDGKVRDSKFWYTVK